MNKVNEAESTSMKEIQLTKGYVALVDDEDYDALANYKWNASVRPHTNRVYARRTDYSQTPTRVVFMHRQILGLGHGDERQGDHKDGNTLDNRRANLRIATRSQNKANEHRRRSGKPFIGVHKHFRKYRASIKIGGKMKYWGGFSTAEEAAHVYDTAALQAYGEFARLNFPDARRLDESQS